MRVHKQYLKTFTALLLTIFMFSCKETNIQKDAFQEQSKKKIGVLLVNHGSRSETWRNTLLQLEKNVTPQLMASKKIEGIKTAFMEYNEPSIATRLKEFDKEGFTDVILVPIFLKVSSHSFEDIPTIIGQKEDPNSKEMLKIEKIERYTPRATVHLTPLLDFSKILNTNVLRRVEALSKDPANEGFVLVGYGDQDYEKEWLALFNDIALHVKQETGIDKFKHAWCGHLVSYDPGQTTNAINEILKTKEKAIVIPVLVAYDENFQIKIIGGGISNVNNHAQRVSYKPDGILPDPDIENWVVSIVAEYENKIK